MTGVELLEMKKVLLEGNGNLLNYFMRKEDKTVAGSVLQSTH